MLYSKKHHGPWSRRANLSDTPYRGNAPLLALAIIAVSLAFGAMSYALLSQQTEITALRVELDEAAALQISLENGLIQAEDENLNLKQDLEQQIEGLRSQAQESQQQLLRLANSLREAQQQLTGVSNEAP